MLPSFVLATAFAACNGGLTAPDEALSQAQITTVVVEPGVATLGPRLSLRFAAEVRDARGRSVQAPVRWEATGGSIDAQGIYIAGANPGEYEVRALTIGEVLGMARIRIDSLLGAGGSPGGGSPGGGSTGGGSSGGGSSGGGSAEEGSTPAGAGASYLVVGAAGSLNGSEQRLRDRLRSLVGEVSILDDDQITTASVGGCRLVVMSKTVTSTKIGAKLKPVDCGVLFWEDNQQKLDMLATIPNDGSNGTHWESTGQTIYVRPDALSELRGGLAGSVPFYTASGAITHSPSGEPLPAAAMVIAEMYQGSSRKAIYAYERGRPLADGTAAAGRRVYFGLYDDTFDDLTADGLRLFDAAVAWAAGTGQTTPVTPPPTTPPPTPPTTPSPTTSGIEIRPGESIQSYVDTNPEGTTFVLKAGVHRGQRIKPRNGQAFVGEPGAVLDGDGADFAFRGTARDVTIKTLVIEEYRPGAQMGAIKAGGHSSSESTEGWTIEGCEIRYNEGGGVRTGNRTRILNSKIHHNSQIGIVGIGDDVVVEGNEIAYNNWERKFSYGWEAGGTKFVKTRRLVVRNNWSHHNWGPGLWTDIDNIDVLYERNLVEDNADSGIFHEISYRATIRGNTIRRNGFDRAGAWAYGAGILVAHSPDVEVYDNTLEDNQNGIMGIQQDRGSGAYGPHSLANLYVHDNRVVQRTGQWAAGAAQDVGDRSVFARNIRFDRNEYVLAGDNRYFEWDNGAHRAATWRSTYQQDMNGTFRY